MLKRTANQSEVCQYYAFYFDIASPQTHPELWKKLRTEFGPDRKKTKAYPDVHIANAFVGNYLRIELLSRYGDCLQLKNEVSDYFLYMARQTGTLWEKVDADASCNHGFASHIAHCLYRDVLGVAIDPVGKIVKVTLRDVGVSSCSGILPTPDGSIKVSWKHHGDRIICETTVPEGYQCVKKNLTDKKF